MGAQIKENQGSVESNSYVVMKMMMMTMIKLIILKC